MLKTESIISVMSLYSIPAFTAERLLNSIRISKLNAVLYLALKKISK